MIPLCVGEPPLQAYPKASNPTPARGGRIAVIILSSQSWILPINPRFVKRLREAIYCTDVKLKKPKVFCRNAVVGETTRAKKGLCGQPLQAYKDGARAL